jgi:quinol monooxygenase YgiN
MLVSPVVDIQLLPDTLDEGRQCLRDQLVDTRKFDGCIGVNVLSDPDDECHVQLFERWESREQYEAYRQWRRGDGDVGFAKFKVRPNVITYWNPLDF